MCEEERFPWNSISFQQMSDDFGVQGASPPGQSHLTVGPGRVNVSRDGSDREAPPSCVSCREAQCLAVLRMDARIGAYVSWAARERLMLRS